VGAASGPTVEICRKAPDGGPDTSTDVDAESPDADDDGGIPAPEDGGSPSDANPAMR
jgi:hypothetical protein